MFNEVGEVEVIPGNVCSPVDNDVSVVVLVILEDGIM